MPPRTSPTPRPSWPRPGTRAATMPTRPAPAWPRPDRTRRPGPRRPAPARTPLPPTDRHGRAPRPAGRHAGQAGSPPAPAAVGAPGRQAAVALDRHQARTGGAAVHPGPAGLLRHRELRPVQCPDPGPGLPRGRPALAAGRPARRSARAQARLRGAVAAPGRAVRPAAQPQPFRRALAPADGAPPVSGPGRATGAGVHLRRPRALAAERLVLSAV